MATHDDGGPAVTGMELADAVEAVRQGLMTGAARGAGSGLRFEVGEIHMEFTVQLQRVRTGHGGVKAWVVDAGAESAATAGRTHAVSFTLRPKDALTGRDYEIGAPDAGLDPAPQGPEPEARPRPGAALGPTPESEPAQVPAPRPPE